MRICRFSLYLEAFSKWFTEIFSDFVNPNAAHSPHSQRSDQWVGIFTVLKFMQFYIDFTYKINNGHQMFDAN